MSKLQFLFITKEGVKKTDSTFYKVGECVSHHRSYPAAVKKAEKFNTDYANCIVMLEGEAKKYKPETVYKKMVEDLVQNNEDKHRADILNQMIDVKTKGEQPFGIHLIWITQDWGFKSFKDFQAKYIDLANKLRDDKERQEQERADKNARIDAVSNGLNSSSEICYNFPAVMGVQGGKAYYIAAVPVTSLVKIFTFDEDIVSAEFRAQRQLNESRAKAISDYVLNNIDSYVLPALTATVSEEMVFKAFNEVGTNGRIGMLSMPMDCLFNICDGQHRLSSWKISLKEVSQRVANGSVGARELMHTLKNETISVQMHFDSGLQNSQQIFSDINSGMVRPSTSISALYNHRDPFNGFTLEILDLLPNFKRVIDMENNTVGKKSIKLFSLVAVMKFITTMTGVNAKNYGSIIKDDDVKSIYIKNICNFINGFSQLKQWDSMLKGAISGFEARNDLIIAQTVFFHGLALVGSILLNENGCINQGHLERLKDVDVIKEAACWNNRCVVLGKMVVTTDSKKAIAGLLCRILSVQMSEAVKQIDEQYDIAVAV